ncbi:MAG: tRNA (guanosine(46)-N7)-methyltransferase TrmB [Clostridiales bacterium]|nr:tRNA (guanosine(46)-N7)-methyltransferase TrmB [Clostridiales bacterium]
MRLRKEQGVLEKLMEYKELMIFRKETERLDLRKIFMDELPVKAEFGTGKGQFIVEMAKRNPEINFIGVELRDQVLLKAVKKASDENIKNVKFLIADVNEIDAIFEENSLDGLYLNFSDPWPKKRHYKRRLTYRDFIRKYDFILKDDSWIEFKTDNLLLFQFTLNELADLKLPMRKISLDVHLDSRFEDNIMTEYEDKFSRNGNKIMSVTFKAH